MISYYKKVFLALLRFSFEPTSTSALFGPVSGGFTSLFGGSGDAGSQPDFFGIASDQAIARDNQSHNQHLTNQIRQSLAAGNTSPGSPGGNQSTSMPAKIPTFLEEIVTGVKNLGGKLAGNFLNTLGNQFINQKVSQATQPNRLPAYARGIEDKQYMDARFPGTTPWEQLGSSGAGSSQGGRAVASEQRRSARDVAGITSSPALQSVHLEYQRTPHEIRESKSRTGKNIQETKFSRGPATDLAIGKTAEAHAKTEGINISNKWINRLSSAENALKGEKGALTYQQRMQTIAQANLARKQLLTEVQKTGLTKANREQQEAYARILKPIKNSDDLAQLMLALGTLGLLTGATRGLGGVRNMGRSPMPKKKVDRSKWTSKQWRQWRMETGKINKQTGELYP